MRALAASEGAVLVDVYAALLPEVHALHRRRRPAPQRSRLRQDRRPLLPGHSEPTSKCDSLSALRQGYGGQAPRARRRSSHAHRSTTRVAVRDVSLSVNRRRDRHAARTERRRQDDDDADAGGVDPADGRPHFDRWRRALDGDRRPRARQRRPAHRSAGTLGAAIRPHQPADLRAAARPRRSRGARRRSARGTSICSIARTKLPASFRRASSSAWRSRGR